MAEIEMELSAKSDPAALYTLVQATLAEAATLPASPAAERQGCREAGNGGLECGGQAALVREPGCSTGGECAR